MRLRDIFATNLRKARSEAKLNQDDLADLAGINRGYVSNLENGRYSASIDVIEGLATALKVPPDELLRPQGKRK